VKDHLPEVKFHDLGLIDFKTAWDLQESLLKSIVDCKLKQRELPLEQQTACGHHLLFCEHPHVFTLGKGGSEDHLLVNQSQLDASKAVYYRINRGGDITYHGPGQMVGYPILDLDWFFNDIHRYLRYLEEAVIRTLAEYGISAGRIDKLTGVWIDGAHPAIARKICAFGVRCSRWVTMHGFALNVNTNLDYFNSIVPCGINDKAVTSMEKELGMHVEMEPVKEKLRRHLAELFGFKLVPVQSIVNI
jgi:lipoyl(octanoyl) transferase